MNLHAYFILCADHDWSYKNSTDINRIQKGITEYSVLLSEYKRETIYNGYRKIFEAWTGYISGLNDKPNFKDFS